MKKYLIIIIIFLVNLNGCSKPTPKDMILEKFVPIKNEFSGITEFGTDEQLQKLFSDCISICNDPDLDSKLNEIAMPGFADEKWDDFNLYVENFSPALKIIVSEGTIYMSANTESFLKISKPDSISHKFFSLANDGWYDQELNYLQLTKDIWPVWIDGDTVEFQIKKGQDALKKWEELKSELDGVYLKVAESTIAELNSEIESYNDNLND